MRYFDKIKFPPGFRNAKIDTGPLVQTKSECHPSPILIFEGNILHLPSSAGQDAGMSVRTCLCVCVQPERADKGIIQSTLLIDIHFGGMKN